MSRHEAGTWARLTSGHFHCATGLHHPMGGTRMDPEPRGGVVDENCRVHGLENLYVAGSSVFASGLGYPTPCSHWPSGSPSRQHA